MYTLLDYIEPPIYPGADSIIPPVAPASAAA